MNDELAELRREIAAARGLGPDAVPFLRGQTLHEIEASADALAKLFHAGSGGEQQSPDPLAYALANADADKQRHRRDLVDLVTGRARRRDEQGRFTARAAGFDGGARRTVPTHISPEQAHNETILQLARLSRISGAGGW